VPTSRFENHLPPKKRSIGIFRLRPVSKWQLHLQPQKAIPSLGLLLGPSYPCDWEDIINDPQGRMEKRPFLSVAPELAM
jgi:hypothetical protein